MDHFERAHVATIVRRLAETPTRLIAVFGPRQTGKTTIVRQALRQVDLESRYLAVDATSWPMTPTTATWLATRASPH